MIETHPLGNSDLQVSAISLGCMSLQPGTAGFTEVVHAALDVGINFLDTADLYDRGENEIALGKALQGKRDQVILATKVGNQWNADGEGWSWNPRKKYILTAVEDSLRRLGTDYLDLYQLHGGTIDDPIDETIEAFEGLKEQGKIRAYGISSIRPNVIREYIKRSNIVSVMMQYSLLDRRPEEACLSLLAEANVSVITRGTVAKGLLAGKPAVNYLGHEATEVGEIAKVVAAEAEHQGVPMAQVATQYVLQRPAVASAVLGLRTLQQLGDATDGFVTSGLVASHYAELRAAGSAHVYDKHR